MFRSCQNKTFSPNDRRKHCFMHSTNLDLIPKLFFVFRNISNEECQVADRRWKILVALIQCNHPTVVMRNMSPIAEQMYFDLLARTAGLSRESLECSGRRHCREICLVGLWRMKEIWRVPVARIRCSRQGTKHDSFASEIKYRWTTRLVVRSRSIVTSLSSQITNFTDIFCNVWDHL